MKAKKNKDLEKDLEIELINDLLEEDKTVPVPSPPPVDNKGTDNTIKISETSFAPPEFTGSSEPGRLALNFDRTARTSVGGKFALRTGGGSMAAGSDVALVQSENLRVAQQRIFELEQEIARLRTENEQLAAAGETIRKRSDELLAENDTKSKKIADLQERLDSEKEILENSLKAKDREIKELQLKNSEYEMRLSTNLQKIRVRERELENRLELVKMESTAVVRSKDEMILELKRQLDQRSTELENYRTKGHELNRQIGEKQETLRRTVKALRLALNMLEGSSDESEIVKKAK